MRCLREAVRLKRPERWQNNDWILHVGNARPHTVHVVLQFLAKHSTIQIPHPPYSPDLAPNDFFLYPKLKINLKGRKFDNVDMIQAESKATLRNLSKSDFISCFDNWKKRWNGYRAVLEINERTLYVQGSLVDMASARTLQKNELRKASKNTFKRNNRNGKTTKERGKDFDSGEPSQLFRQFNLPSRSNIVLGCFAFISGIENELLAKMQQGDRIFEPVAPKDEIGGCRVNDLNKSSHSSLRILKISTGKENETSEA
ncbi:hypothetical protein LAZ67_13002443 [Cordylochernes scorpioides]|uniref:Transposase n=1 Tax=Cordylochernes scorpioides TaxID=51811 RepID=A0ABY6L840_9ARAC|nr:hypothetical protein LAZ67_13002443 [Cordylochernes scorpioides]